jgi:hypothetical protein
MICVLFFFDHYKALDWIAILSFDDSLDILACVCGVEQIYAVDYLCEIELV